MDLVAAGISADTGTNPEDQQRLLEQIRADKERKELEAALEASRNEAYRTTRNSGNGADFFLNQQRAMEQLANQRNPHASRREELIQRGTSETQEAISSGQAHIVICRGCTGRLQAPKSYSLVYCPRCQTITPV